MPIKVYIVKAMVFPVAMYGFESWTIKKAEHQRIHDLSHGQLLVITLPTKVHLVKGMGFPVVMYGCENWNIKKDES